MTVEGATSTSGCVVAVKDTSIVAPAGGVRTGGVAAGLKSPGVGTGERGRGSPARVLAQAQGGRANRRTPHRGVEISKSSWGPGRASVVLGRGRRLFLVAPCRLERSSDIALSSGAAVTAVGVLESPGGLRATDSRWPGRVPPDGVAAALKSPGVGAGERVPPSSVQTPAPGVRARGGSPPRGAAALTIVGVRESPGGRGARGPGGSCAPGCGWNGGTGCQVSRGRPPDAFETGNSIVISDKTVRWSVVTGNSGVDRG